MKARFEFDLTESADDRGAFKRMSHADNMCSVLWDTYQWLRSSLKHGHNYDSADDALEAVQQQLLELMDGEGINLDDLWS